MSTRFFKKNRKTFISSNKGTEHSDFFAGRSLVKKFLNACKFTNGGSLLEFYKTIFVPFLYSKYILT